MSLVEAYHAEHKARLYRMGGKPKPAYVPPAPVIKPIDPAPYYAGMWFHHLVNFRETTKRQIKVDDIQRAVCRHYKVNRIDLLSHRRTKDLTIPRHIAMYLAKKMTMRSLPEIGRLFGGRDHTTVLHSVRKIEALEGVDDDLMARAAMIEAELLA